MIIVKDFHVIIHRKIIMLKLNYCFAMCVIIEIKIIYKLF